MELSGRWGKDMLEGGEWASGSGVGDVGHLQPSSLSLAGDIDELRKGRHV